MRLRTASNHSLHGRRLSTLCARQRQKRADFLARQWKQDHFVARQEPRRHTKPPPSRCFHDARWLRALRHSGRFLRTGRKEQQECHKRDKRQQAGRCTVITLLLFQWLASSPQVVRHEVCREKLGKTRRRRIRTDRIGVFRSANQGHRSLCSEATSCSMRSPRSSRSSARPHANGNPAAVELCQRAIDESH